MRAQENSSQFQVRQINPPFPHHAPWCATAAFQQRHWLALKWPQHRIPSALCKALWFLPGNASRCCLLRQRAGLSKDRSLLLYSTFLQADTTSMNLFPFSLLTSSSVTPLGYGIAFSHIETSPCAKYNILICFIIRNTSQKEIHLGCKEVKTV